MFVGAVGGVRAVAGRNLLVWRSLRLTSGEPHYRTRATSEGGGCGSKERRSSQTQGGELELAVRNGGRDEMSAGQRMVEVGAWTAREGDGEDASRHVEGPCLACRCCDVLCSTRARASQSQPAPHPGRRRGVGGRYHAPSRPCTCLSLSVPHLHLLSPALLQTSRPLLCPGACPSELHYCVSTHAAALSPLHPSSSSVPHEQCRPSRRLPPPRTFCPLSTPRRPVCVPGAYIYIYE